MRKLFKQLARRAPFDPPHDLAWRHHPRITGQNVDVILAHRPFHYPDLRGIARLTHQLSNSLRHVPRQYFIPVLRYPHKVYSIWKTVWLHICTPRRTSLRAGLEKPRGLTIDPKLAVGDGALGFWKECCRKCLAKLVYRAARCIKGPIY